MRDGRELRILPPNRLIQLAMLVFQIALWLWLLLPAVTTSLYGLNAGLGAFLLSGTFAALRAHGQKPEERPSAYAFCITFGLVSSAWLFVTQTGSSFFSALLFSLVIWAGLFLWLLKNRPAMDAEVLGYDDGFAIVRIEPSLVAWVPPGIYAVTSKPVRKGKSVLVGFDLFTRKGRTV